MPRFAIPPVLARLDQFMREMEKSWEPVRWYPRLQDSSWQSMGLITPANDDPHDPPGLVRCPQCWDPVQLVATNARCPTCFGTGWTGGYATPRFLRMFITQGNMDVVIQPQGEVVSIAGTWGMYEATTRFLIPGDLVLIERTRLAMEVGRQERQAGLSTGLLWRSVDLLPLAPDSPLRAIPGFVA